jgi:hypothetical protein
MADWLLASEGDETMATRKRRAVDVAARLRETRCIELRAQGWTLDQIAAEVGFASSSGVSAALRRGLDRHSELPTHQLRRLMAHQLNTVLKRLNEFAEKAEKWDDYVWISDRIAARVGDLGKLYSLNLTREDAERQAPYQKRIILDEGPGQPLLPAPGEVDAEE